MGVQYRVNIYAVVETEAESVESKELHEKVILVSSVSSLLIGQFNFWRFKCTVLGYDVNNTKGENRYVTQSPPLSLPRPPSIPTCKVCLPQ